MSTGPSNHSEQENIMTTPLIVILVATGLLILIIIAIYNSLISARNRVENAFGGIDVQLKQRYDLIPNLVATVMQYAKHEKELLEKVTSLRAKAIDGNLSNDQKVQIDNKISASLRNIVVAVENYPDLKANENFINLQRTMNEIESQISAARRSYNAAVTEFNTAIETFPRNLIAGKMKLNRREVFIIPEQERQNVNVGRLFD